MFLGVHVVSIALSGGTLLGRLTAFSTVNDGSLPFDLKLGEQTVRVVFYSQNSSVWLLNTSTNEEVTVTFSIPSIGDLPPCTVVLPGMWEMRMDSLFQSSACLDNSRFFLTACAKTSESSFDRFVFAAESLRRNLPFGGGEFQPIGSYLEAKLGTDNVSLKALHSARFIEVQSVSLFNSSDSRVILTGSPILSTGCELSLPCSFSSGSFTDVNVVCVMSVPRAELPITQNFFDRQQKQI